MTTEAKVGAFVLASLLILTSTVVYLANAQFRGGKQFLPGRLRRGRWRGEPVELALQAVAVVSGEDQQHSVLVAIDS